MNQAYTRLIAAIILQAARDQQKGELQSEINMFLESEWFSSLADYLEIDAAILGKKILSGQYRADALHAVYRISGEVRYE